MVDLFFKRYGHGDPLIVLHGLLGANGNWHTLSKQVFGDMFEVFTIDQRNHGRSPHTPDMSYEAMADDLYGFMRQQGIPTAHILGHSMGGKTAMRFATTYPMHVDKLVVVDIAPKVYPPRHKELLAALQRLNLAELGSRQAVDDALASEVPDWGVRQFLLKNLASATDGTLSWKMNLDVLQDQYERINEALPDDAAFDGPTLFVRGAKSDYVQDEDQERIQQHFPQAQLVTIPDAGHWVHADAPDALSHSVRAFLEG